MTGDMDNMTLLEFAADSIGFKLVWQTPYAIMGDFARVPNWNPLANDWEALRLSVELGIDILQIKAENRVSCLIDENRFSEDYGDNPLTATRRAIVRAAASIGRKMYD